ncbi:MAG: hypothetical protein GQ559_08245 [Desulfobulbaceae bacterium]|nr:hypothetical protein [Desulfobulbaceae bacterium]
MQIHVKLSAFFREGRFKEEDRELPDNTVVTQVNVFSNDQVWARYEAILADIFDHLIAALPQLDPRVFK